MFKCHKFILAMVSSMFQAMFYGSFPQTEDIVKIPDVTPTAFQHMLRYAYGENIELDGSSLEDALDTLYCAKRHLIAKLARTCRDYIQIQMTVFSKDPCVVVQRAPQLDEEDLAALALAAVAQNAPCFMSGDAFPCLSFASLKRILDYPYLTSRETVTYQSVCRWVTHNVGTVKGSALRDAFGSLLYSIRFPLFSAAELADGPVADGILTGDELSSLFGYLFAKIKPTVPFLTAPRTAFEEISVYDFQLVTSTAEVGELISNRLSLIIFPYLAPECCAFLRQLVDSELHIQIASFDNEYTGKTVTLPADLSAERNVLSHSVTNACWFEWDVKDDTACNVRIGVARKPHSQHSAVFGFILNDDINEGWMPFKSWDDKRIQGISHFERLS